MTDTIGWGDVDVEPRRRRLPGVPRLVVWLVVAVVVAAVVTVPRVTSHFADDAAAWLAGQWKLAASYDTARSAVITRATEQATADDTGLFMAVVHDVDHDEAVQLTVISARVRAHRSWSGDVARAQRATVAAIRAKVHDLLVQADHPHVYFSGSFYVDPAETPATSTLLTRADDLVAAAARHRHVHAVTLAAPQLDGAARPLAELDKVTTSPLPLRLVIAHDGDVDVWNLQDGSVRRNVSRLHPDDGQVVRSVGDSLLVQSGIRWFLVQVDGGPDVRLPAASGYLPAGDDGLWQVEGTVARRLDTTGGQVGPTYTVPAGFDGPFAAVNGSLVIAKDSPYAGTLASVWTPATGGLRAVPGECSGGVVAAADRLAYAPCGRDEQLDVMDVRTGAVRRLPAPSHMHVVDGTEAMSRDGRRVAALVNRDQFSAETSVAVWDLTTGRSQLLPGHPTPVAWSPDGSVLIVNADEDVGSPNRPLSYWTWGAKSLLPIRIPVTDVSDTLAVFSAG